MQKTALVLGAGGFIGHHMVKRLQVEGFWVRGVDLKDPEYEKTTADSFQIFDLRNHYGLNQIMMAPGGQTFDQIYQFAADMGGAGYVFTGTHDADIMHNSAMVNLNVADVQNKLNKVLGVNKTRIFYSSSACMYPERNQLDPDNPNCREDSAYPADPDSEYGWEKLVSERFYLAASRNWGIPIRIARYHNIFGPLGTWDGGREKSPAAMCRKVALAQDGGEVIIWGDGEQTRSFLYIDECIEATRRLMDSDCTEPLNIGSEEMISINNLALMAADIAGKKIILVHDLKEAALGVRGRNSDNTLYSEKIGWAVSAPLRDGLTETYKWISEQIRLSAN
ncbi:NAD-dependent epimerase/dehydratase family protein [Candidatus Gracilibacteria bacterium]|nr:NAD-dependent epimerase/dehydratase family protein [Candidatus Gracilibacteria bacterium]